MKKYKKIITTIFLLFLVMFCFGSEIYAQEDIEDGSGEGGNGGGGGGGGIPTGDDFCTSSACDSVGVFIPSTYTFKLKRPGFFDLNFIYAAPSNNSIPVTGDFDGDSLVTVGFYEPTTSTFHLRNSNTSGATDLVVFYGAPGTNYLPIVGDFDGDGRDTVGLYRPDISVFYLRNSNTTGFADLEFQYGAAGTSYLPIVGDFNGDGKDTIGLYRADIAVFYLRNSNTEGFADITFSFPIPTPASQVRYPIVGNWAVELQ